MRDKRLLTDGELKRIADALVVGVGILQGGHSLIARKMETGVRAYCSHIDAQAERIRQLEELKMPLLFPPKEQPLRERISRLTQIVGELVKAGDRTAGMLGDNLTEQDAVQTWRKAVTAARKLTEEGK